MAQHQQYYQIVTQDQIIQTVSLEELQRYYPNLCVESNTGVQYLINNQDDAGTQFQSQQVLVSTDQQIVLNTEDTSQQIIVEQGQVNYQQQPTQQYTIQEEMVTEYTQPTEINNTPQPQQQQQQQIFYSAPPQKQIIQQAPASGQQMVAQLEQRQMVIQQTRVTNHINQQTIRQVSPQQQQPAQINNHNILNQRRMPTAQQQVVIQQPQQQQTIQRLIQPNAVNIQRQIQPNNAVVNIQRQLAVAQNIQRAVQPNAVVNIARAVQPVVNAVNATNVIQRQLTQNFNSVPKAGQQNIVRMQYTVEQPNTQQLQQQPMEVDDIDDKQQVLVDGRYMTMKQFKQEYSPNRTDLQQTVTVPESIQPQPKPPAKPRAPRRNPNPRGNRANRGGGRGNQNNQIHNQNIQQQQTQNHVNDASPKPFQQITNSSTPKQIQTYPNRSVNQIKSPQMMQRANNMQPQMHMQPQQQQQPLQQIMQPQIPQNIQQPASNIQHVAAANQHRQITPQNMQPHMQQSPQHNILQGGIPTQHIQQPGMQPHATIPPQYQQPANRVQPLIPLSPHPHVPNGHVQNNTFSPSPNHGQTQTQYMDDSSNLSDDYKDSARMLVCLENGEQRLITFTLPKESCTVQDLLEQVGVPFNADTKIECISNPGSEIDYIVNVGAVNSSSFPMETQQVLSVENVAEPQECIVSPGGKIVPISELPPPAEKPEEPPKPKSPEKPPEPPKEVPKFIPGCLAVCNHCGYVSEDFNRCQRCKTKLREDVKCISNKLEEKEKEKKPNTPKVAKVTPTPSPRAAPKITLPPAPKVTPGGRNLRAKRTKPADVEPVVLTLSSDDEEPAPKTSLANANSPSKLLDNNVTLAVIQKEPVINATCDIELDLKLFEDDLPGESSEAKKTADLLTTNLPCRTVRIGSFKFVPKEEVLITTMGITILAPAVNDITETCKIFIPMTYIIKVLYSFNKSLPVLFFYVTPSVATHVRKQLSMEEGSDLYFDPLSKDEPHKRITLLPDVVLEDTKNKIKEIYQTTKEYNMLEELSAKEANDILVRTCPKESSSQKPQIQSVNTSFSEMRQLVIYPPGKGGIAISNEDYLCLAQDQFLNDVIIDFYLKYLTTDVLDSPMQEKVYIFSSFFYKRLTTKPAKALKRTNQYESDPNLSAAEKRHFRVKKWTKNVNIFEKDYVIIPINENMHWFLAIICFPGLDGCRSMNDSTKIIKEPAKEKKKANTSITIGNTTITTVKASDDKKQPIDKPIKCDDDEVCSDRDEAEGDESELEESDIETETTDEKKPNVPEPIQQPCILIFDSLAAAGRSRVVATLRDYLTCEYKAKLKGNKTFTKDNIKGACPKIPQQMNFTDCGLYVLQYVESFFKTPITDYRIPIKQLKNWFEEIVVTKKREDISNLIRDLMLENNKNPNVLPDIVFPTLNGELVNNMEPNFSENEEDEDEDGEFQLNSDEIEKMDDSLGQLQTYNSDSGSESPITSTNSSPNSSKTKNSTPTTTTSSSSTTSTPASSTFVVTTTPMKADTSSELKKSNRETMSYLKSKRITRHKNSDTNEVKKQKINE